MRFSFSSFCWFFLLSFDQIRKMLSFAIAIVKFDISYRVVRGMNILSTFFCWRIIFYLKPFEDIKIKQFSFPWIHSISVQFNSITLIYWRSISYFIQLIVSQWFFPLFQSLLLLRSLHSSNFYYFNFFLAVFSVLFQLFSLWINKKRFSRFPWSSSGLMLPIEYNF